MDLATRKQTPTVRLRRLAAELKALRANAQLTRDEVSRRTSINSATLFRVEYATARPQKRTLMALLDLYGVTDEDKRAEMFAIAKQSNQLNWLQAYEETLPEQYSAYLSFEADARSLRNYQSLFVPGLLQTEDYTRAVIRGGLPHASDDEVESLVAVRMRRQEILKRKPPLKFWAVMDEAVIRRRVGSGEVMSNQLRTLAEASRKPHITLQVLPFASGAHPGMDGSFTVMDFPEPADTDLVYIESRAGDLFLERDSDVQRYSTSFDHLRAMALDPTSSAQMLEAAADAMK